MCCGGRCASCCADIDCEDMSACEPGQCWDGVCLHDRPFSSPEPTGAVEAPADVLGIRGMGSLVVLGLSRTILVADLRVAEAPRFISSLSFPGPVARIEASPPLVLALVETPGHDPRIHVIDLSLPRFPRTPVVLRLDDLRAADLDASLLAAVSPDEMHLVDVSSPGSPAVLSRIDLDCPEPVDVEISGSQAMVACGAAGHVLVDVGDPRQPTVSYGGEQEAFGVSGSQGRWMLLGREGAPAVLVTTSPDGPPALSQVDVRLHLDYDGTYLLTADALAPAPGAPGTTIDGDVIAGALDGGRAYLVRETPGGARQVEVRRLDETPPGPAAIMPLSPFAPLADVAVQGRRLVLAGRDGGILVVDAADPGSPRVDNSLVLDARVVSVAWTGPREIAVAEEGGRLVLVDTSPGPSPAAVRPVDRSGGGGAGIVDVEPAGRVIAVTCTDGTLETIEHRGVDVPFVSATIPLAGTSAIASLAPGMMLVSGTAAEDGLFRVQTVALDPDGTPCGPASDPWMQPGPQVASDGKRIFDAVGPDVRVRALDGDRPGDGEAWVGAVPPGPLLWHEQALWVAGPGGIVVVSEGLAVEHATGPLPLLPPVSRLAPLAGGIALIADAAVITAETSLPPVHLTARRLLGEVSAAAGLVGPASSPRLAAGGSVRTPDGDEVQLGARVLAIDGEAGLVLVSLGDDGLAVLVPGGAPSHLEVAALDAARVPDAACVATGEGGLAIVDLSDPARPVLTEILAAAGHVTEVATLGLNCYAMQPGGPISVASLVDAASPRLLGTLEPGEELAPSHLWSAGPGLVVASGRRLVFVDVPDPPAGTVTGSILLDETIEGLAIQDGLVAASGTLTWFVDLVAKEPTLAGSYDGPWHPRAVLLEGDRLLGLGDDALWTLDVSCLR